MSNIQFVNPYFLLLILLLIPLFLHWRFNKKKLQIPFRYSRLDSIPTQKNSLEKWMTFVQILRGVALVGIIIALARPQSIDTNVTINPSEGVDIVLSMDVSGSMLAQDLQPDRLGALKKVAGEFINERINDRIGLVVYAAEAYTKSPVTSDHTVILTALNSIKYDNIIQDGTNIGMGLGVAINRLKNSIAKSKVIVLMTDGENNYGQIAPISVAQIAKQHNIKVYTIGIGTIGKAKVPIDINPDKTFKYGMVDVRIDEKLMQEIAKITNGKYYRATDNKSLKEIYNEINQLEKTKIDENKYTKKTEWFRPFALFTLLTLIAEFILRKTKLRAIV